MCVRCYVLRRISYDSATEFGRCVFEINGKYLLMKRAENRRIAPGVWSGIGGHIEPPEINNPLETCYREIEEETGIMRHDVSALELRYIITRRRADEISVIYVFFGETTQSDFTKTDEGDLQWIPENELLEREYSQTYAAMLEHYVSRSRQDRAVYVGVADDDNGKMKMTWTRCEDFETW